MKPNSNVVRSVVHLMLTSCGGLLILLILSKPVEYDMGMKPQGRLREMIGGMVAKPKSKEHWVTRTATDVRIIKYALLQFHDDYQRWPAPTVGDSGAFDIGQLWPGPRH